MKKYLLYICVATLLISCRKDEVLPTTESGTMSFAAQMSNSEDDWSAHSRGAMTTSGTINSFSAFGFRTGSLKWAENGSSTLPNKMFNQLVERSGNDWVYTPEVMWDGGDVSHFSFFGYSPYSAGTYHQASNPTGNNIELVSSNATAGAPVISFAPLADIQSQVDLLIAKPVLDTRPVDYVKMDFAHALTQVRFKGWTDQPNTIITSIKIKGVVGKGSLNIGSLEWVAGSEIAEYLYAFTPIEVSTDKALMTDLSPGTNVFMLLPQDMTANTTAVVEFSYTIDGVSIVKEYVLKEDWMRNQAMTYTVNLTLADKPLGMTVEITPWVIGTGGVGDADVEVVLEEGSYIPNSVLLAAGWPVDILPIEGGLQVAMMGNVLPGGTAETSDSKMVWSTEEVVTGITEAGLGKGKGNYALLAVKDALKYPIGQACKHLGPGWYVPSLRELELIYKNKGLLLESYQLNDVEKYYWNSTELDARKCYLVNFTNGYLLQGYKDSNNAPVRCVKGTPPPAQVDVTPTVQDIPVEGGKYTVKVTSSYAWTANSTVSGVTITPSSGAAGTNVSVQITVPANATTSEISYPVVFTTTGSGATATTTWAGTQLAPPLFIEINGYKWANGNLVADGPNSAKIGTPIDYGLYFQFGSLVGWNGGASGDGTGTGSSTATAINVKPAAYSGPTDYANCGYYSTGTSGGLPSTDDAATGIGDPCRYYLGSPWRTPTTAEHVALNNSGSAWQSSPVGMNFNNNSTKLFIPASGYRTDGGSISGARQYGHYWSESVFNIAYGYHMYFHNGGVTPQKNSSRRRASPVRCVTPPPPPAISVTTTTQADIPAAGRTYTVQLTSNYAWSTNALPSGVTVNQSSGAAGITTVEITIPVNTTTSEISYPVVFTATGGGTTANTTWTGTQLAPLSVEFNGIEWAIGNLVADGANGAKIGAPTDYGLYFKFGSLIGWAGGATGDGTGAGSPTLALNVKPATYTGSTDYATCGYYSLGDTDSELPAADVAMTGIGDPCRYYLGSPWRLPTTTEFTLLCNGSTSGSLVDANAEWQVSPAGMNFNNDGTKLFIPAAGHRDHFDGGQLSSTLGTSGYYSTASASDKTGVYALSFNVSRVSTQTPLYRQYSFPARCIQNVPVRVASK